MTIGGWISMTISFGLVLGLFFWCCYKMITAPESVENLEEDELQGVLKMDPKEDS